MSTKYAGVTLDFYDDKGETLKKVFPTADELPDFIKTANVRPQETLNEADFALVAILDGGHVMQKFACTDEGTTAMSVIYFMEHGEKLPDVARKHAAARLVQHCNTYNLTPPDELKKLAAGINASQVVDMTGKRPTPQVKVAAAQSDEDYAVVLPDGKRFYPIHTWDLVKKAEAYFADERIRMQPEIRRQYAVKLAAKAEQMGYPLAEEIKEAGATGWATKQQLRDAIDMRKVACAPGADREFLDELFEKRASVSPTTYAECLRRFDVQTGLDKGWDHMVLDPWASTFGVNKEAEVIWEDGAERVTKDDLLNVFRNHLKQLREIFTEGMLKELQDDPEAIFMSLPLPQKKILSRLASDQATYHSELQLGR